LVGIGRDFVLTDSTVAVGPGGAPKVKLVDNSRKDLASLVAGSAAFPLVFSPHNAVLGDGREYKLADGGLIDNSGAVLLGDVAREEFRREIYEAVEKRYPKMAGVVDAVGQLYPNIGAHWFRDFDIQIDAGSSFEARADASDWEQAYAIMSDQIGTVERMHSRESARHAFVFAPANYFNNDESASPVALVLEPGHSALPFDPDHWQFAIHGKADRLKILVIDDLLGLHSGRLREADLEPEAFDRASLR